MLFTKDYDIVDHRTDRKQEHMFKKRSSIKLWWSDILIAFSAVTKGFKPTMYHVCQNKYPKTKKAKSIN